MIKTIDFFWPVLEKPSKDYVARIEDERNADIEKIKSNNWGSDVDIFIDEARRIHDQESNRRSTAETKAGIYLAAVGAFAPLLASLATSSIDGVHSRIFFFVNFSLMALSFSYLFFCGLWAIRALKVTATSRVDVEQLLSISKEDDPKRYLLIQLLCSSRCNREPVNDKVTRIKMTNAFLVRAIILITVTLLFQGMYPAIDRISKVDEVDIDPILFYDIFDQEINYVCQIQIPLKPNELCIKGIH